MGGGVSVLPATPLEGLPAMLAAPPLGITVTPPLPTTGPAPAVCGPPGEVDVLPLVPLLPPLGTELPRVGSSASTKVAVRPPQAPSAIKHSAPAQTATACTAMNERERNTGVVEGEAGMFGEYRAFA